MDNDSLIGVLALVTLVLVVGYGVFEYFRVQRSKAKRGEAPIGEHKVDPSHF
jgi:hypothetical protein